jgi:glycosyltransferase involved in cell wall biosynthesis
LTVAIANNKQRIRIKGLNIFLDVAKKLPEIKFTIVGIGTQGRKILGKVPNNVELVPILPKNKLLKYYQRTKVIALLSMREGLPNVLCEAMLCGCIPIGFNNGGIPVAIGDAGYIVDSLRQDLLPGLIKEGIKATKDDEKRARNHIIKNFPMENRRIFLKNLN